ncbi:MAG TPA: methionyl-tRNA formyltransferase, partial [Nitrospiria bacterium]|nr:methionyl-tRNA formyltransferase [Nitrospiria bacterium]
VILDLPPKGCINVHASLLPKYRGAAPINWAVINGETETGITTMQMDPGMDTGDMLLIEKIPIAPEDTAGTLFAKLSEIGGRLLIKTLEGVEAGTVKPIPQDNDKATMAPMMEKETGKIDWTQTAVQISNRVRGLDPWPGAFTFYKGERLRLWKAAAEEGSGGEPGTVSGVDKEAFSVSAGDGRLRILEIQPANSRRMTVRDFLAGRMIKTGERLGE